jgi:integrase
MRRKLPSYRLHKPTGQAVVTLGGKDFYLGKHGTPESRERYDELVARWLLQKDRKPELLPQSDIEIRHVLAQYTTFIRGPESPYRKEGELTRQVERIERSLLGVRRLFARTKACEFGPKELKTVRRWMLEKGWARTYVNALTQCIKQCFTWAASESLIPGSVAMNLRIVKGIRTGTAGVRETAPVRAVAREILDRTLPQLGTVARDLVQLQYLTGMRPCEAIAIRWDTINEAGALPDGKRLKGVWVYQVPPEANKNHHREKDRFVCLGPEAQAILSRYRHRVGELSVFSPSEAADAFAMANGRKRRTDVARAPSEVYAFFSYAQTIRRACRRAQIENWSPNRLRHLRATEIRSRFGGDAARVVLGHALPGVTGRYAEADLRKAAKVMRRIG